MRKKREMTIQNLYLTELGLLHSILSYDKKLVTTKEVIKNNPFVLTYHGLSPLGALRKHKNPLVIKGPKIAAREGHLWSFNDDGWDRDTIKREISERIKILSDNKFLGEI